MKTIEVDRQEAAAAELKERNNATYHAWLAVNPKVLDCEANALMFSEYLDVTNELTAADFDFAFGNLESSLALSLVKVPTPQQIVDAENKHRKSLSLPQLHELNRKEQPLPTRGELPQVWYDQDISTAAALRVLAKKNIQSFKQLVERFGSDAVNARLGSTPFTRQATVHVSRGRI